MKPLLPLPGGAQAWMGPEAAPEASRAALWGPARKQGSHQALGSTLTAIASCAMRPLLILHILL